jgi:tetratricopeptide (TPR) repeat protein
MDIDEFLDKELGKGPSKKKASLSPEQFSGEVATLITSIQYLLTNKQFDQIEETYDSLWKKIAENKFSWDVALHSEVGAVHDQLNKELGAVVQDFYKKAQLIEGLMANARMFLNKNEPEAALKVYNEISEMAKDLPSIMFEHKKTIERDVLRLYRDIHEKLGASTVQKVHLLSRQISAQASRIRPYLLSGNIPLATEHYLKLLELYATVPQGFLPLKVAMGKELIEMYKSLSIQIEIEDLRKQLHPLTQRHLGSPQKPQQPSSSTESLLRKRKEAAKIHMANKSYENALIEIHAILGINPTDEEAKQMLDVIQTARKEMKYGL